MENTRKSRMKQPGEARISQKDNQTFLARIAHYKTIVLNFPSLCAYGPSTKLLLCIYKVVHISRQKKAYGGN